MLLVFRELLQNSDDAASKAVEIHFETQRYLDCKGNETSYASDIPKLKTEQVKTLYTCRFWLLPKRLLGRSVDLQEQWHNLPGRRLVPA